MYKVVNTKLTEDMHNYRFHRKACSTELSMKAVHRAVDQLMTDPSDGCNQEINPRDEFDQLLERFLRFICWYRLCLCIRFMKYIKDSENAWCKYIFLACNHDNLSFVLI